MNKVEKIDDENLPSLDEYLLNGGGKSLKEILLKIVLKNSKSKKTSKKASKKISKKVSKKKQVSNKKRKKVYRSLSPVSKYLI
jgi:hypothetical protein